MESILIVDDERVLRDGLKNLLTAEGYDVRLARDGEDALKCISAKRPDLVLLDVMMPKMNGFRCCEEIRRSDALLPVIFLTAKDADADQVRGLGLGADDYVSKDAGDSVLLARVKRALARVSGLRAESPANGSQIALGAVVVDTRAFSVVDRGKTIAYLTRTEMDLLKVFDAHRDEVLVIDDLISELRGSGFACEDAMLYSHVANLRRKLGSAAPLLVNRRGVGYCLLR